MDKQKLDELLQFAQQLLLSDDILPLATDLETRMASRCDSAGQLISTLSVQLAASLIAVTDTPQQLHSALAMSRLLVNQVAGAHLLHLQAIPEPSPTVH